jgi:hypothetical protein
MSIIKAARRKGTVKYERHKPEQTLLYQIIEKYYPQFLTHMGNKINICPSICGQNLKRTSSAVVWNMGFCEYVVKIVTMSTWLHSVDRSCASMRSRHLCILHIITPRVLVVVCQTQLRCAANGRKRRLAG